MRCLVLSTWFPYPLDQGSKIRAYYLLKALADQHQVGLVSFADKPIESQWIEHLSSFCHRVHAVAEDPFKRLNSRDFRARLGLTPAAARQMHSPEMDRLVRQVGDEWKPDVVLALTFVTAPYAGLLSRMVKVFDIDNIVSNMLFEDFKTERHPAAKLRNWIASWKFRRYERKLISNFDLCLTVSDKDRRTAQGIVGGRLERFCVVPNGVDCGFNQVITQDREPFSLIYNGSLAYAANYDAMTYFLAHIYPALKQRVPNARLTITGSTDNVDLARLALDQSVRLTGALDDIRGHVGRSALCVVPLRKGGGSRLKILEAMALGTPVISTSKGAEGLHVENGVHLMIADEVADFAEKTSLLLHDSELSQAIATRARRLVESEYEWSVIGQRLNHILEQTCRATACYTLSTTS